MRLEAGKRYVCENGWVTPPMCRQGDLYSNRPVFDCDIKEPTYWDEAGTVKHRASEWNIIREFGGEREEREGPEKTRFKPGPAKTRDGREAYVYWIGYDEMHCAVKKTKGWYLYKQHADGCFREYEASDIDILPNAEPECIEFEGGWRGMPPWEPLDFMTRTDESKELHMFFKRNKGKRFRTRIEVVE